MPDRTITTLIVCAVALFFGVYFARIQLAPEPAQVQVPAPVAPVDSGRNPKARVKLQHCRQVSGRTEMIGFVENTGTLDLRHVEVQSVWFDRHGRIIETGQVFAVDGEPLRVGERRAFSDTTSVRAAECNARLIDLWAS